MAQKQTNQKSSIKKLPSKSTAKPKQTVNQNVRYNRARNQRNALFLFFGAIFLIFLIFIDGQNLWLWLHNLINGFFGFWSFLIPATMVYLAVVLAKEREQPSIHKSALCMGIVLDLAAVSFFLNPDVVPENSNFFEFISSTFAYGIDNMGSGLIGACIANPLSMLLGEVGAQIVLYLILVLLILTLTNTELMKLFHIANKPVRYAQNEANIFKERMEERRAYQQSRIDIPYEAQDELKKVIRKNIDKKPVKTPTKSPLPKVISTPTIDYMHDVTLPDFDELQSNPIKPQDEEPFVKSAVATPIDSTKDELSNVKKVAEEFMKRKEEAEKNELANVAQNALYEENANKTHTYCYPPLYMLKNSKKLDVGLETQELQQNGQKLVETLRSFNVETSITNICRGPSVTRYELQPAPGVRINKITNLADDLAMNLEAVGVRIEAPIPGKAAVGIEVPNKNKSVVRMRELVESNQFATSKSKLTVVLGRDITGEVKVTDLAKMPHTLIAGTTGSGKSVCINSLIVSLMYKSSPDDVRFLMIDPKVVELGVYNGIPHLLVPVVTDPRKAAGALAWAVTEMLNRYKIFALNNVKDLAGYNKFAKFNGYKDENDQPLNKMPQIVIVIDELADLMMAAPNEVEDSICRLAQMARAAGMHLVVATQRPTVDVVTGLIKANIPSRIAFAVSSTIDSRTILDGVGAEKLLGQGDMLFSPVGSSKPTRIQGCFVEESEIENIVTFVKKSREIEYDQKIIDDIEKNAVAEQKVDKGDESDLMDDPMMDDAIKCVMEAGQASTSLLQRRLRLGHARAGRLIDQMSTLGIVGPYEGSKPRQLLMTYPQWLERNMQKQDKPKENPPQENL